MFLLKFANFTGELEIVVTLETLEMIILSDII